MMKILLVIYDNESYIHWFPQGPAYIASALRKVGHEVHIYQQDLHHHPDQLLTRYLDEHQFDIVGIGIIAGYYQYGKLLGISEAINRSKNRPFFLLGGHGPSPEPEYFIQKTKADAAVIGEGDETIVELANCLSEKKSLNGVKGLAYREGDQVRINPRRSPISDIDAIPFPAYDMFPMEYYRLLRYPYASSRDFAIPILSGRGCPFECTFCYRMEKGLRIRSTEGILEEMKMLNRNYGITYFVFSDELLISSVARATEISEALIMSGLKIKWACQGRLNFCDFSRAFRHLFFTTIPPGPAL